ncbi:hypothetical protein [Thioalkalivibrio sp. ALE19]|uniref:hypothetical protein n=1 Tax=Thioalkalivibrio sp. ALE19 TaxID=1266909 RepID=UPI00041B09CB|nr:hypothetical protein [Thioalkalivibrio sp. ALE19]
MKRKWLYQENDKPPALAPAALVEAEWRDIQGGPSAVADAIRVDEVPWSQRVWYRLLTDRDGTPYCSAEGLEPETESVATHPDGTVVQIQSAEAVLGTITEAPETHRHPASPDDSVRVYRVWR